MPKQTPLKAILSDFPHREVWEPGSMIEIEAYQLRWLIDRAEKAQKAPEYPELEWHEGEFSTKPGSRTWAGRAIAIVCGDKSYWAPLPKQIHVKSAVGSFRESFAGAATLTFQLYKNGKPVK